MDDNSIWLLLIIAILGFYIYFDIKSKAYFLEYVQKTVKLGITEFIAEQNLILISYQEVEKIPNFSGTQSLICTSAALPIFFRTFYYKVSAKNSEGIEFTKWFYFQFYIWLFKKTEVTQ